MSLWVPIEQGLMDHRKTLHLAEGLGITDLYAVSHLLAFWLWAMTNTPAGEIPPTVSDRVLARAGRWEGKPEQFVNAMLAAGFLDADHGTGGYLIHDWDQYGGKLIAQRKAGARRAAKSRGAEVGGGDTYTPKPRKNKADRELEEARDKFAKGELLPNTERARTVREPCANVTRNRRFAGDRAYPSRSRVW